MTLASRLSQVLSRVAGEELEEEARRLEKALEVLEAVESLWRLLPRGARAEARRLVEEAYAEAHAGATPLEALQRLCSHVSKSVAELVVGYELEDSYCPSHTEAEILARVVEALSSLPWLARSLLSAGAARVADVYRNALALAERWEKLADAVSTASKAIPAIAKSYPVDAGDLLRATLAVEASSVVEAVDKLHARARQLLELAARLETLSKTVERLSAESRSCMKAGGDVLCVALEAVASRLVEAQASAVMHARQSRLEEALAETTTAQSLVAELEKRIARLVPDAQEKSMGQLLAEASKRLASRGAGEQHQKLLARLLVTGTIPLDNLDEATARIALELCRMGLAACRVELA